MNYDFLIVGAGPSGLAAAIKFKKMCIENNKDYSVCVVEKGTKKWGHTFYLGYTSTYNGWII